MTEIEAVAAAGADSYGNPIAAADATWSFAPAEFGTLSAGTGAKTILTAG